jgi:hypothetical protein
MLLFCNRLKGPNYERMREEMKAGMVREVFG